ncbi:MAG: TolC family protein [Deltaproteobacteria bacterium]
MAFTPDSRPSVAGARAARTAAALLLAFVALFPTPAPAADEAPVSVSHYVDLALRGNPSLASMQERIRMKENAAVRAGSLDDPKAWLGISNLPVNSWSFREEDMTGKEIGVSQMFPFPGKRKLKTAVAASEKEQTEFDLQEMRNMLRADVKMAYAELAAVRRQAGVVRRSREIVKEVVAVSQEMYAVGKATQSDVHRGQVEFEKMREMLVMLESREKGLAIRLNTLAALPPGQAVPALDNLAELPFDRGQEELLALYRENRPARKGLQARVRKGEASVAMARREYYPDIELSASYMQRDAMPDGTSRPDMFSSMLQFTLPVWRAAKLDPAVREMSAERDMARRDLEALDLEAANSIGGALAAIESRSSVAALIRTTIVPHSETAFETTLASYRVGKVDFPMLMDTIVNLLSLRKDYEEMVGDLHMQRAKLEAAVGRELE